MNEANHDVRKCPTVSPRKFWFMFAKVPGFGTFANGTFAAPYCTICLNGRPLLMAGRSGTIIHYEEYTQNLKNFLELRIGRKKRSKEFL